MMLFSQNFDGNGDRDSLVINMLPLPVTARYVRIHPENWSGNISMRFELLGVPVNGTVLPKGPIRRSYPKVLPKVPTLRRGSKTSSCIPLGILDDIILTSTKNRNGMKKKNKLTDRVCKMLLLRFIIKMRFFSFI